jgi:5-(carboxyamino)imidazole ribonucleotide mutase
MSERTVAVIMGSDSDMPTMQDAIDILHEFGVPVVVRILSAHRTPDEMLAFARTAADDGIAVIVAGAGGAAHLPGMVASATTLPVIGVPVVASSMRTLGGMDALLSMVQMPAGIPVATVAIGNAKNAGLLAIRMLAIADSALRDKTLAYQRTMHDTVVEKDAKLTSHGA